MRSITGVEKHWVKPPVTRLLSGCQFWPKMLVLKMSISWNSQTQAKCFELPVASPISYKKSSVSQNTQGIPDRWSKMENEKLLGENSVEKVMECPLGPIYYSILTIFLPFPHMNPVGTIVKNQFALHQYKFFTASVSSHLSQIMAILHQLCCTVHLLINVEYSCLLLSALNISWYCWQCEIKVCC